MNVLFLDIDGVLNNRHWYDTRPKEPRLGDLSDMMANIDPAAVARVNRIVAASHAVIVLCSSWRALYPITRINRALLGRGLESHLFGATPDMGNPRGGEIKRWLAMARDDVEQFVILDDSTDMDGVAGRLVQTDYDYGLVDDHVELAIRMLRGETRAQAMHSLGYDAR